MDIRCRKTSCKYNNKLTCTAPSIAISDGLFCGTYEKVENKGKDISSEIFNNPPEIANYRHSKKLSLKCGAMCLFNRGGHCIANGITVNSVQEKPLCITFLKP